MKIYYRSGPFGDYTQAAHYAEDGKPAASSFPGHISEAQVLGKLASYRRQVAEQRARDEAAKR